MAMKMNEMITYLMNKRDMQQKKLAELAGVGQSTVSHWKSGRQEPNPKQRRKICEIFGVTEAELYGGPHQEIGDEGIPIVSSVGAADEEGVPHFLPHEPPYEKICFKGCKAVTVESNSMAPIAYKGQKIIYCEKAPIHDGDLVFVGFSSGAQLFKRYFKNHGDVITFHGINPVEAQKPIIKKPKDILFCYKVIGIRF